jgi:hypothetical protein
MSGPCPVRIPCTLSPAERNRFEPRGWRTFWILQEEICMNCRYFEPLKNGRLPAALCHEFGDIVFIYSWFNHCTEWKGREENMLCLK